MAKKLKVMTKNELYFTGMAMIKARGEVSQERFAEICGWTQQYQYKLELPGMIHRLTEKIQKGLTKAGVEVV